jgi:hypothetical protein
MNDHQHYRYMTVDDMKSLGDDSLQIDVTRDERAESNRVSMGKDSFQCYNLSEQTSTFL